MVKRKQVVGIVVRNEGLCQKTDDEIIRSALFYKSGQLERTLERTFALTEQFHPNNGRRANAKPIDASFRCPFPGCDGGKSRLESS